MIFLRRIGIVGALLLQSLIILAADLITSPMSPVVSFQFLEDSGSAGVQSPIVSYQYFDSLTESGITISSPIVSYQYYEWPGDDVLHLLSSPPVSFFYQPVTALGQFVLLGRVTDTNGAPLSGATVSATVYLSPAAKATTDVNGNFQMPSLGAGVYALSAADAAHQMSMRAFTLNANTVQQNFQLKPLPSAPGTQQVIRSAMVDYTVGDVMGSVLRVFDGSAFVRITTNNWPSATLKTIVMTRGWVIGTPNSSVTNTPFDGWPPAMAAQLRAQGVNPASANILAWDWRYAATATLPNLGIPTDRTLEQGVALGEALQHFLGTDSSLPVHFLGHSLGTLVNASAINYLHSENMATGYRSPTPWTNKNIHVTVFDQAQLAAAAEPLQGSLPSFQSPLPAHFSWADSYNSLVSPRNFANAVNVNLQKGALIAIADDPLNPMQILSEAHAYAVDWYGMSITRPSYADNPLGFKRSYEYAATFPPSDIQTGSAYHQAPFNDDELALEPATVLDSLGPLPDVVMQGTVDTMLFTGETTIQVVDTVENKISGFFNYVGGVAAQSGQAVVDFFDSAALQLRLRSTGSSPSPMPLRRKPLPQAADSGNGKTLPPMAWLPIQFPADATAMAFDFTVEGDPIEDVLVCGIGPNKLYSLAAKFIPTNLVSASRLIDVSVWAGTTNELFFGFMGGTSTNAVLQIENIRFYSLQAPHLEFALHADTLTLSWPTTAGGYIVESAATLTDPIWQPATNAPAISGAQYVLAVDVDSQARFFRLRAR